MKKVFSVIAVILIVVLAIGPLATAALAAPVNNQAGLRISDFTCTFIHIVGQFVYPNYPASVTVNIDGQPTTVPFKKYVPTNAVPGDHVEVHYYLGLNLVGGPHTAGGGQVNNTIGPIYCATPTVFLTLTPTDTVEPSATPTYTLTPTDTTEPSETPTFTLTPVTATPTDLPTYTVTPGTPTDTPTGTVVTPTEICAEDVCTTPTGTPQPLPTMTVVVVKGPSCDDFIVPYVNAGAPSFGTINSKLAADWPAILAKYKANGQMVQNSLGYWGCTHLKVPSPNTGADGASITQWIWDNLISWWWPW